MDLRDQLQTALGSAYTLERELGGGGMARVFLAEETALGRPVVIKVLPPEVAHEMSAERFAREIRVSARLQHPNIVPVLTAGAAGSVPYYTMPYIDGESLRARLARLGAPSRLPLSEAMRILRDVARALAHAHGQGVVHRDIKPENVLLSGDAAVVADFGIARAVVRARAASGAADPDTRDSWKPPTSALTAVGLAVGTPAYMAPEQASGDPDLDFRADLYAWGLLAYELLTGAHPFADRASVQAMVRAQLIETPTPLSDVAADLSPTLSAVVMRCLAKDPAARPAATRELIDALDTVHPGRSASDTPRVVAARAEPGHGRQRPFVAVLPFANVTGDADNEPFSDGLTDELISALGKVAGLKVAGRTSVFALKGRNLAARAIADTLGVTAVLEGSVRRAGQRLKVSAQLVNAADDGVLWTDTYDRQLADVFAVQEDIARAIVAALSARVGLLEQGGANLVARPPASLEAYELYLKGRHFWRNPTTRDALERAAEYFARATVLDPTFARAYSGLSDAHTILAVFGFGPAHEEFTKAKAAALAALELDPELAEAHVSLAHISFVYEFDWATAERQFRRAIALDPSHPPAHYMFAVCLQDQGRFDEALAEMTLARTMDPLAPHVAHLFGRVYVNARRPDDAIPHLQEAVELLPNHGIAYQQLGHAYLLKGMHEEAIGAFTRAAELSGPRDQAHLAYGYAVTGRRDEARRIVSELVTPATQPHVLPFHLAMAFAGLGEVDIAFDWLERGLANRASFMDGVAVTPAFEPLHADARWQPLLRRMGLAR
ncbi:MAG TPA: protein kinase [Gemmatimonadaceae bacterium]|nr:protein kinase [Gemmatimonadaceae bacterium]